MELLWISLIGGLLALDGTSVGQFMVSRPLVAGAIAGALLGDPTQGLLVGAFLELYLLVSVPSGGARFPEGATAAVVAVATASALHGTGAVPFGVAAGLVWGQVGGLTISGLRRLNGRLIPEPEAAHPERLTIRHLTAIGLDYFRGTLVTFVGVVGGRTGARFLVEDVWPLEAGASHGLLLVGGAVSGGILLRNLGGFRRRRVLFALGLAVGIVGARFL